MRRAFVDRHVAHRQRSVVVFRCDQIRRRHVGTIAQGGRNVLINVARPLVVDGAQASVRRAAGVGGCQRETVVAFIDRVCRDGGSHQERRAAGRNLDITARRIALPAVTIPVLQRRAVVRRIAHTIRGCAFCHRQLDVLTRCTGYCEHRIRRAFVHQHIINVQETVVVEQRSTGTEHRPHCGRERLWCGRGRSGSCGHTVVACTV